MPAIVKDYSQKKYEVGKVILIHLFNGCVLYSFSEPGSSLSTASQKWESK